MKRPLLIGVAAVAAMLPQTASAKVVELGSKIPPGQISCPTNCQAISRVTGYQSSAGDIADPFVIPRAGKIVAFTVRLGEPDARQVRFFEQELSLGEPSLALSILRKGRRRKTRNDHRLLAQSTTFTVKQYFGSAPTFALDKPIRVARGSIAALTVPTWAPALALGIPRTYTWNSSRPRRRCKNVTQRAALTALNSSKVFGCSYRTARMYYTVTYIPDPRATRKIRDSRNGR